MTERYRLQRIELAGTPVGGWSDYVIDRGYQPEALVADGTQYEQGHIVPQITPSVELTGTHLETIFGWTGSDDLPLLIPGSPGTVLYGALQAANKPGFAANNHWKHTIGSSVLHLAGLSWSQGQAAAQATIRCLPYAANSITDPIVPASSAAIPAGAPTEGYAWRPLSLSYNGTALAHFEGFSLSIDPALEHLYQDGGFAPTGVAGTGAPLSVALEVETAAIAQAVGAGAWVIVLRRLARGGGFDTAANNQLTLTLNAGSYVWRQREGGGQGSTRRASLLVRTRHDGTSRPFTWALATV